jgi:hypothetical protein
LDPLDNIVLLAAILHPTSPTKSPVRKIAFPERGEVGGRKPFQQEAQGIVSPRWQGTIPGFDDLWERAGPTGTDWGYVRRVIDDWKEKLRCPKCRKTAMASLCQAEGDDTPTVEFSRMALGS